MGKHFVVWFALLDLTVSGSAQLTPRNLVLQKLHEMVVATRSRDIGWFKRNLAPDFKAFESDSNRHERVMVERQQSLDRISESFQMFARYDRVSADLVSLRESQGALVAITRSTVSGTIVNLATKRQSHYADVSKEEAVWVRYGSDYKLRTLSVLSSKISQESRARS